MSVPCVMYFYKTLALLILTANFIFAGKVNLIVCFHSVDEAGIVELEKKYDLVRVYFSERLKTGHYCTDSDIDKLIEELSASGIVKFAEKNSELSLNNAIIDSYINQYHLNNPNGPDINWLNADSYSQKHSFSEEPIIIAVIDTGFTFGLGSAFNNNDLLVNLNDPVNGIDDDGNGYVDDYLGWDFSQNDNDVSPELTSTKFNHGNKVASMIFGEDQIAGFTNIIADQNIKLLPLKVGYINDVGEFRIYTSNWIIAAEYAMDMGAHIINLSLGGGVYKYSAQLLIDTLENEDVLVVASAGNQTNNNDVSPHYPSDYPNENIISVASIQQDGELSDFSNFGSSSVDIAAPGTEVWAYDPSNTEVKTFYDPNFNTIGSFNTWRYGSLPGNLSNYNWGWAYDYINNRGYLHDGTGGAGNSMFNYSTPYQNNTNNWIESGWLNLAGIKNPELYLEINYALNSVTALDFLNVEISTDGVNYDLVTFYFGRSSTYGSNKVISLANYVDQSIKIRFRLLTSNYTNYVFYGVRIVDLNIRGAINYTETNGTSFSAPIVASVAALMKSLDPTLSASEIREIIIKTATPQVPLEGKVVSGGVLNSYDALHAVHNASKLYYSFNLSNWFHREDAFNGSLYGNLSFRDFENFKIFINSVSKNPDDTHRLVLRYYGKNKTDGGERALIRNFTINNSSEFFLKIVDY